MRAILDAPNPQNVSQLRSFLGMLNYYANFLPNVSTTLAPLYSLATAEIEEVELG